MSHKRDRTAEMTARKIRLARLRQAKMDRRAAAQFASIVMLSAKGVV